MSTIQAAMLVSDLQEMGGFDLADEVDSAVKSANRYASM
jgi:hypothetical protein